MRSGFLNAKKEQKKQRRSKVKEVEEDLDLDPCKTWIYTNVMSLILAQNER